MKSIIEEHDLLTPRQVCELLQINNVTLWRWTRAGKIPIYGAGHKKFYKRTEVLAMFSL